MWVKFVELKHILEINIQYKIGIKTSGVWQVVNMHIWGSHSDIAEGCYLLRCSAVSTGKLLPMFGTILIPPYSGWSKHGRLESVAVRLLMNSFMESFLTNYTWLQTRHSINIAHLNIIIPSNVKKEATFSLSTPWWHVGGVEA